MNHLCAPRCCIPYGRSTTSDLSRPLQHCWTVQRLSSMADCYGPNHQCRPVRGAIMSIAKLHSVLTAPPQQLHMNFVMNHDCAETIRLQGELYLKIGIKIQKIKTISRQINQRYAKNCDRLMHQAKGPTWSSFGTHQAATLYDINRDVFIKNPHRIGRHQSLNVLA